jgi:hypothetical protein
MRCSHSSMKNIYRPAFQRSLPKQFRHSSAMPNLFQVTHSMTGVSLQPRDAENFSLIVEWSSECTSRMGVAGKRLCLKTPLYMKQAMVDPMFVSNNDKLHVNVVEWSIHQVRRRQQTLTSYLTMLKSTYKVKSWAASLPETNKQHDLAYAIKWPFCIITFT